MRRIRPFAVSCILMSGLAASAAAQTFPPPAVVPAVVEPLSPDQDRELDAWLSEMEKWQSFLAKNNNRPARDPLGRIVARPRRPAAPAWLHAHCAALEGAGIVDLQERTARACRLAADAPAPADPGRVQTQAARVDAEKPDKYSSFLRRIHLDGLGITPSSGARAYGIVGSHLTLVDVGRVQVFGPPGVLLLSVPDVGGNRRITLGYTWGVSVRLTDVRLAAADMTLFLTVSKVWVSGSGDHRVDEAGGFQIAGLSLAPRKKR